MELEVEKAADGSHAIFSRDRLYRYWLERPIGGLFANMKAAVFIMLNPSTADAFRDDPTVARCRKRAEHWGCGRLIIVNLFAYRSTYPKDLAHTVDPVGPCNNEHLQRVVKIAGDGSSVIVAAWGDSMPRAHRGRADEVVEMMRGVQMHCLGKTSSGQPRHPLHLSYTQDLESFDGGLPS